MAVSSPGRVTYDEFVRYTEAHPSGQFEVLDGVTHTVSYENMAHKLTRLNVSTFLHEQIDRTQYTVASKGLFPAPGWDEGPKTDAFVARGALDTYVDTRTEPTAIDILLVIEIRSVAADETLERKLQTYTRLAIPELWVIDFVNAAVLVHRDPSSDTTEPTFRSIQRHERGESIEALAVDGLFVNCTFLLKLAEKH